MAGYDGLSMSSQSVVDVMHLSQGAGDNSEAYSQASDFSGEAMFNDLNVDLSSLPVFTPNHNYDFVPGFDDSLAYNNGGYFDNLLDPGAAVPEFSPANLDNKLLGFGAPIHLTQVLDSGGQTWPRLAAELNGMFSIAEDVFEGETVERPLELTCYRRNLFQISGAIILSRTMAEALMEQGGQVPIQDLVAVLSATESIEGKPTEIISVPWKAAVANSSGSEDKAGTAPANIPIDLSSNQEADPIYVNIPIAWRRLQFKYATANNGRRKGLQQHYQIQITLMAKTEGDGQLIKIAEIQSNPIVVRGRSPKNFDSSKDVPLSERKQSDPMNRMRSAGSVAAATPQWIEPALSQASNKYYPQKSYIQPPLDQVLSWPHPTPPSPGPVEPRAKRLASGSPVTAKRRPPVPTTDWHHTEIKEEFRALPAQKTPIGLSVSDDDVHTVISDTSASPPTDSIPTRPLAASPLEKLDQLYEYFPLSLDDWMQPVDAIYRPHVVHHLRAPEVKAQEVRSKPKRYFSAMND
ncbi:hypothetical protein VC83_09424 [Pseudogymnoascus destructans]|uniref:NDT80 domain-containing protein n=2 Tax=Pseudogymnoascus destructans TaxID=655981 RepID=L8FZK5_PSED2|nr:uncharacterized protein VC83_09424 [Pseudogymnoascus destructans]ELR05136.1 hypothetical protein GMDG_07178 [Pseudogymnoascus destructans 20631-21]OAF54409.1 hypothetical protein VC83_09424 [Pseudogymnoascus destructans]